ncbi:MAG: M13 family metallopeptidase [Erysipelotrichaceae bacterium]|nr:M13 family metallopeptidase [Erysipelotrichaceae bacterium]
MVRIQDDLYEYVNGEWLEKAIIPDDRPTIGGFANLAEDVEKIMMNDFKDFKAGTKHSDITGMHDAIKLYNKIMDTDTRNALGIKPLMPLLDKIKAIDSLEKLNDNLLFFTENNIPLPVDFGVDANMQDATSNCFIIQGPSIILPDTTYYGNETGDKLLAVYKDMALKLLAYTNLTSAEQEEYINDTLAFDALVASQVKSMLEWADYVKNHNPMPLDEVCNYLQPLAFKKLLAAIYDQLPEELIVYDPKAIKNMNMYFNNDTFKQYIHWAYVKTLLANANKLSQEMAAISTTYRRCIMGIDSDPILEKQAYQIASSVYSEPCGIYYGRTYFGEEAKKDIISLVKKIIDTYKDRIAHNNFLEEATKQKAILKLSTINIKMGYPDDVRAIYKEMIIDDNDNYFEAMNKINKIKIHHNLNKLYKPVDKNEWQMPGHMVNACYDPSRNDITFPAAILQKPFYALSQSVSENLGGIGTVIAHEISHAFDNNGAHFDENGNLFNWWSENDSKAFKELTNKMIKQWDGIPFGNTSVNGELVVSENIADNGGMAVTLQIMHTIEEPDFKAYFINWAKIWCQKAKDEYIDFLLKNDVHSPCKLRANIQVRNFKEWYDTFDVTDTDQMYIKEEDRIIIW